MALDDFFSAHSVFRYDELHDHLNQKKVYKDTSLKALLRYHLQKKHIARIRRGYYVVITNKTSLGVYDPLLIAGRVNESALIAYHSALSFHGIAYSLSNTVFFSSETPVKLFDFQQVAYQRVLPPKALPPEKIFYETKTYDRLGLAIRVTNIERTLVDCLDKPQFSGGFEEIWRATSMIDFIDAERMANYAILLNNATTIAKLGFFLEQHQEHFKIEENILSLLEKKTPKGVHYFTHAASENHYLRRWKLMVPTSIKNKTWEEQDHDI